ncbi:MAG: hypothetical protein AB1765_09955 [Candidatus Hydrogenedentota bacterium]
MVGPVDGAIGGLQVAGTATPQPPSPADLIPNPAILPPEAGAGGENEAPPQQNVAVQAVLADQGIGANVNEVG